MAATFWGKPRLKTGLRWGYPARGFVVLNLTSASGIELAGRPSTEGLPDANPAHPQVMAVMASGVTKDPLLTRWFSEFNDNHFAGELELPSKLTVSARLRKAGGYFRYYRKNGSDAYAITISKKHWDVFGEEHARSALLHEMVHCWEFLKFGQTTHGKRFQAKAREMGAPLNCGLLPVELFKYVYQCPGCGKKVGRSRKVKVPGSCRQCGGNVYNPKYRLALVASS